MDGQTATSAYAWLSLVGILVAVGFALAIVVLNPTGSLLHEAAGTLLLALLVGTLLLAIAARRESPRLLGRTLVALALLIAMGTTGALLGAGVLTPGYDSVPVVLLVGLVAAMAEMMRVARGRLTMDGRRPPVAPA